MRRIVFLHCDFFIFLGTRPAIVPTQGKHPRPEQSKMNDRGGNVSYSSRQNLNRRPPKKNKKLNYLHFAIDKRTKLCYNCITTNSTVDTVRG